MDGAVNTGVAIANPNAQQVTLDFYFSDESGATLHTGVTLIPAHGRFLTFLNEQPFAPPSPIKLSSARTFTFSASMPIALTPVRTLTNERSEFLMTPLPVLELQSGATPPVVFPYYVDGEGWESEVQLVNPTGSMLSGSVQFFSNLSTAGPVQEFPYTIPPRSGVAFQTTGAGPGRRTGWVRIAPTASAAPSGSVILSFRANGTTVTQTALHGTPAGSSLYVYADASTSSGLSAPGSTHTDLAISNPASTSARIDLELLALDGTPTGSGSLTVTANSQIQTALDQIPGLRNLQTPFRGFLRIKGDPVAVIGLRRLYNERGDLLLAAVPAVAESIVVSSEPRYLYFVDGGSYVAQFVAFRPQR
jgi:hypothetical protein